MEPQKRKKILFIVTKGNWGGAQRYAFDLATHLPAWEVAVAMGEPGRLTRELENNHVPTHIAKYLTRDIHPIKDLRALFELKSLIGDQKPNIVHISSSKAGVLSTIAARLGGVEKIIFTAHGWPHKEVRFFLLKGLFWFLDWLTILLAHHTICVSEDDLRHAKKMPGVSHKVSVIYNGIDIHEVLSPKFYRGSTPVNNDTVQIVTIAELTGNKALERSIKALAQLNKNGVRPLFQWHYTIFGEGEDKERLERLISKHKLGEKITLAGFVPDVSKQLKDFDIFLLPSRKEGLPYTLLEAGNAGLAVVATGVGGIPEIVAPECGLVMPSARPFDETNIIHFLTQSLTALIMDPAKRREYGHNLKKRIKENFSLERMLLMTREIYEGGNGEEG